MLIFLAKQTFRGITCAVFARLRKKASRIGFPVAKPVGSAKKDGFFIHWIDDPQSEVLEVECSTPFWINSAALTRASSRDRSHDSGSPLLDHEDGVV